MTIADATWLATALLHQSNPSALDFSVKEIVETATQKGFVGGARPGLQVHASKHCVANKSANPARHRMLLQTTRGRRRLFSEGDPFHPDRATGRIRPDRFDLPSEYQSVVDWYDEIYSKHVANLSSAASADRVRTPHQFPPDSNRGSEFAAFEEMRSQTAFVGPGGTIVLPEDIQQALRLKEGSCLSIYRDGDRVVLLPISDDYISKIRGSLKGNYDLFEDREREHHIEKRR